MSPGARDILNASRHGGASRIERFQLTKIAAARYDLRDPYYTAVTLPWSVFLALMLAIVVAVNIAFAELYLLKPGCVQGLTHQEFPLAIFFSMETLTTVGYGEMSSATYYGHIVSLIEMGVGMALTATLTGLLFVRLSRPTAKIFFAKAAVVSEVGGKRSLMIRVANGRRTLLTGATAVMAVVMSGDEEGAGVRWSAHELRLQADTLSVFALTWTVSHDLDDTSPLADFKPADFIARQVRIYLMIQAHDPAISADVQDLREYPAGCILFARGYAETVSQDRDGHLMADLSHLSDVVGTSG